MKNSVLILAVLMLSINVFGQENMDLRSVVNFGQRSSDVWGYVDSSGNEYALIGLYGGISIIDVTNPDNVQELFYIEGPNSIWRDIKTWNNHAYVTNEEGGGLFIVDLSDLPNSVDTASWTADTMLHTAHNIFIDENGFAYLTGFNRLNTAIPYDDRGALIADLKNDPMLPELVGWYDVQYCHDAVVRGDTMWTSEINAGQFSVVDVSNKDSLVVLATQSTPNFFTHNAWISDDNNTLFTTDERSGAYITSYDVSDLNNITELDKWQADPGSGLIPHNTHVIGNYLVTSYYKYGVNIIDATEPDNLVEVGRYDTSPFLSEDGFSGNWGTYPYLPSGNILASDIEEGLFVITPTYKRACYLAGTVTESQQNAPVPLTRVEFIGDLHLEFTNLFGTYKTGIADAGTYDIRFVKDACYTSIVTNVTVSTGNTTTLDVSLDCFSSVGISENEKDIIWQANPTIFNNSTRLKYNLKSFTSPVTIALYSLNGQLINKYNFDTPAGELIVGNSLVKGIYLARISNQTFSQTIKIIKQ